MLVAGDEKGLILWNKRDLTFCLHWENLVIVPKLQYNVAWYRCELQIQTVWGTVLKTNRFNRRKLHVSPRTVGITADCVQYIIHTGLCRVCLLLVCVHWAVWVKEWATGTVLQAATYGFWTPVETCNFSLVWNVHTGSFKVYGESSLRVKWPEHGIDHSSPFSDQG